MKILLKYDDLTLVEIKGNLRIRPQPIVARALPVIYHGMYSLVFDIRAPFVIAVDTIGQTNGRSVMLDYWTLSPCAVGGLISS